jgi:1-acyl-sn-glycerol-3-phosphate acyltransferase
MLIMMLSPRVIILTNQWVWDSPFIGKIVKYADFYPVSEGAENSIEPLSRLVEKGYSIMVFPEGTRSEDCSINRFHRGAFFLAEQLHLDIIPIVLHGVGHVLPKTDFMLRKGQMCVDVLPRIVAGDTSFGDTNAQRAKNVRIMYKEHYSRMALEIETPDYFADKVFHNYIYKGAAAGIQTAISLRKHGNYRSLIDCLPRSGRVLVLGSGYGSFPMMLSLVRPSLIIDSVEADAEKIALASNCVASSARITFIEASPLEFCSQERYDAVVCLDLFHTFDNQQQQALLEKYVDHTCTVIISDVRYSVIEKLRIVLSGGSVPRSSGAGDSSWRQLSSHFNYLITQKDNIFAVSRS